MMIGSNPYLRGALLASLRSIDNEPLDLLTWTSCYRAMLASDKPFDLEHHTYLKAIYQDDCHEMIICKAGQVGVSEYLVSYALHRADQLHANVLYIMPTDTHVSDFSTARIGPAINPAVSSYLCGIVSQDYTPGGRVKSVDRVGLKRVRNNFLYLRGATIKPDGRAPQLHSIDADVVILDEYDQMSARAAPLARERLGHSRLAELRFVSTPTYPTQGIYKLYMSSDQRKWHSRCQHCASWQSIELTDLVIEMDELDRPIAWHKDDRDRPFIACRKCGKNLGDVSVGEWVVTDANNSVHGYHLSRLFMSHKPLTDIIKALQATEEFDRQQAYNQELGLPYRPKSSLSLAESDLDLCRREKFEPGTGNVFMGVDVGRVLHVVIRELLRDGSTRPVWIGEVKEFDELIYLMKTYQVKTCVIDALPETREARKFQASMPEFTVWLAYYVGRDKSQPDTDWDIKPDKKIVNADRTRTLDNMLAGFRLAKDKKPGGSFLPVSIRSIPDYYLHLTSLERVLQRGSDGNMVAAYIGDPDHYAHAENYCKIAMSCPVALGVWARGA